VLQTSQLILAQDHSFARKKFLFIIFALIITIVLDTSVVRIYDLVDKRFISVHDKLVFFSINTIACLCIQFVMISYFGGGFKLKDTKEIFRFPLTFKFSFISLSVLGILLAFLIFELFFYNYYDTILIILVITVSYGTASALLIRLSLLFLSWFRSSHNRMVFLYFISMALISFNLILTAFYVSINITYRPTQIREFVGGSIFVSAGRHALLDDSYTVSSIVSFLSIWITSALLMKNYRNKWINAVAYWSILSIPLIYFLVNYWYQYLLSYLLIHYLINDPIRISIIVTAFLSLSKPIGGLTFGILFWNISRSLRYERNIMMYMIVAGWGIFFIFATNQAISLALVPFPPFGLATITVLVPASCLTLVGIYSSASAVSINSEIRTMIYKHALESKLLGLIGRAETEKELQKTVEKIIRDKEIMELEAQRPFDLDEKELKKHLDYVIKEIKKKGGD
jgi:hypothetical protein